MERTHRISAGAIIIQDNKILLVKYHENGRTYLVCPGGGVNTEEGLPQAAIREVNEETGLDIIPGRILFVEDFCSIRYRFVKVWFLCRVRGGILQKTQGAIDEGIIDAQWYQREELGSVPVYPRPILEMNWGDFFKDNWETKHLDIHYADF